MTAFIFEIASTAGQSLLHPAALTIPAVMILTLPTGVAGRLAILLEDARHGRRIAGRGGSGVGTSSRQWRRS